MVVLLALVCVLVHGIHATERTVPPSMLPTHSQIHADFASGDAWPQPDVDQFPDYYKADPVQFTLHAGDTLSFPSEWWHWVFSDGSPTISFNIWTSKPHSKITKPTLFRGAAKDWPAVKKWTMQYLNAFDESVFSNGVKACRNDTRDHFYPEECMNKTVTQMSTFSEFAKEFSARNGSNDPRVCFATISLEDTSLLDDIKLPKTIHKSEQNLRHNIWISHGQVQTGLHYDQWYNTLTVIAGVKRIVLFAPDQSDLLYPAVECKDCTQKQRADNVLDRIKKTRTFKTDKRTATRANGENGAAIKRKHKHTIGHGDDEL